MNQYLTVFVLVNKDCLVRTYIQRFLSLKCPENFGFSLYFFQERITLAEKNERLQSQLRSLKEDLANTRDDQVRRCSYLLCFSTKNLFQAETTMDKIHKENV